MPEKRNRVTARQGLARRRKALGGSAAIMTERARIDAATTPGSAWAKKKPAPLTPAQIRSQRAAGRRETVEPGFLTRLRKALGG